MRVILLQDIEKIGKKFDVKEVADGYARNFLLPRRLAKVVDEAALKQLEEEKEKIVKKAETELKGIQELVAQLDDQEIEMKVKVDENGKLFGSITVVKIAKALKDKGFNVSKNQIKLAQPIKEIGEYDVIFNFPHGLEAKIKVIVVEEVKKQI